MWDRVELIRLGQRSKSRDQMSTPRFSFFLHLALCPQPIPTHQLPPTNCHQPNAAHQLPPTNCHQPIATHQLLPTSCYQLIVTNQLHQPIAANQLSPTNCHPPIATNRLSPTNCHEPIVIKPIATHQLSPTNCQPPIATNQLLPTIIVTNTLSPTNCYRPIFTTTSPERAFTLRNTCDASFLGSPSLGWPGRKCGSFTTCSHHNLISCVAGNEAERTAARRSKLRHPPIDLEDAPHLKSSKTPEERARQIPKTL